MKWPFKDGLCIFMFYHFLLCLCNLSFWPPKHTLPDASPFSCHGYGISLFPVSLPWMWVFPSLKDSFWGRPLTLQSDNSGGTWSEIKMNAVCCGLRWFVQERMWAWCLRECEPYTLQQRRRNLGLEGRSPAGASVFQGRKRISPRQVGKSRLPGSENPAGLWPLRPGFRHPCFTV